MFAVAQCLKNHTSVGSWMMEWIQNMRMGGNRIRGQQQNRQENGSGGQVDKQVDVGGKITRGWGEGEEAFGEGEGGKGDIGADLKVMEWGISFISTFFNFYFCSFKGTLMQIWKSLYMFVFI